MPTCDASQLTGSVIMTTTAETIPMNKDAVSCMIALVAHVFMHAYPCISHSFKMTELFVH